jgi:transcriptional regulator with XRE-family HTH domain
MIADNIKLIRGIRDFSQEYMANQTNIEKTRYNRIESGGIKPNEDEIANIAKLLGVSAADLNSNSPFIINNMQSNKGSQVTFNENNYTGEKELYEKIIVGKDETIASKDALIAAKDDLIASKDAQIAQLMQLLHKK